MCRCSDTVTVDMETKTKKTAIFCFHHHGHQLEQHKDLMKNPTLTGVVLLLRPLVSDEAFECLTLPSLTSLGSLVLRSGAGDSLYAEPSGSSRICGQMITLFKEIGFERIGLFFTVN